MSFISSQKQDRHEVTVILWRWKQIYSVLEHLTGTEYLLTQSMSVAIVSLLIFLAQRGCTRQDVGCVKGHKGQTTSHNRLKNVSLTLWTYTTMLQIVQIWPVISNNLCNWAKIFLRRTAYFEIRNCKHLRATSRHTETHTLHGWLLSQFEVVGGWN